jgi:N-acetylmuramoyl-L-alanine amidase
MGGGTWGRITLVLPGWLLALAAGLAVSAPATAGSLAVTAVRFWSLEDHTRIAIETNETFTYRKDRLFDPPRIFFDLNATRPEFMKKGTHTIPVNDPRVKQIRVAETQPGVTRIVLDLESGELDFSTSQSSRPDQLLIEVRAKGQTPDSSLTFSRTGVKRVEPERAELASGAKTPPGGERPGSQAPGKETAIRETAGKPMSGIETPRASVLKSEPSPEKALDKAVGNALSHAVTATSAAAAEPAATSGAPRRVVRSFVMPKSARPTPRMDKPLLEAPSISTKYRPRYAPYWAAPVFPRATFESVAKPAVAVSRLEAKLEPPKTDPSRIEPRPEPAEPPSGEPSAVPPSIAKPATRNSNGDRSLTRALGLKIRRVVIDPGHGGSDQGSAGVTGLLEKDLVLDVSKRLGALIEERLGSEVVFTRTSDMFVPLEERTKIANARKADLFISVHANSSPISSVTGVETYYLSLTTLKTSLDVAARENATSERSVHELRELVQKIAMKDKVDESREFATRVQVALSQFSVQHGAKGSTSRDRGVKKAPFIVLIGAAMPSILAEIGFLSNSKEEQNLRKPEYRQKLAEALFKGVSSYADSLSHFQVAQAKTARSE